MKKIFGLNKHSRSLQLSAAGSSSAALKLICSLSAIPIFLSGCSRINENVQSVPSDSGDSLYLNTEFDNSSYFFSLLSSEEKEYYSILKDAVLSFESEAHFPKKLEPELLRKLFISVYYTEEEVFWLDSMFYRPAHAADSLQLSYRCSKDEAESMQTEIDAAANKIMAAFDEHTSDYEKLKAFHDHIVLNCTFTKESEYANTTYGALVDGYAQCEGYAFAFDYLCMKADIDCFTVTGTNPEGSLHAWNMVNMEDMWYHVDCTWDDPIQNPVDTDFIRHYYFLVSDMDIIGLTHVADSTYFTLPLCTSGDNYYKREGLYAYDGAEGVEMLREAAAEALKNGRKDIAVRFNDKRAYDKAKSRLFDLKEIKQILAGANAVSSRQVFDNKYVRYCNDEELIIHISMIYQ